MERLKREAEERAVLKRKKELADWKRIEREQRIESLKKTPVGTRALETITAEVMTAFLCLSVHHISSCPPTAVGVRYDGCG